MPVGEIAVEFLGGALRFVGSIFTEVVFEICVKGLGYVICRSFSRSVDPDGILVVVVGFAAWVFIFIVLYFSYKYISSQIEIDRCLDAGGSYNYKDNQCNQPSA